VQFARLLVVLAAASCSGASPRAPSSPPAGPAPASYAPQGSGDYARLLEVHRAFQGLLAPEERFGLANFEPETVRAKLTELEALRAELEDSNVAAWPVSRQVDFLVVRSLFDQAEFMLRIARPWARDPGFYVDGLFRAAFTELPVEGEDRRELEAALDAAATEIASAKQDLTAAARDYAKLALFNLTTADGVGHGHPYRATPPAGVLGWYDDFLARARTAQPELVPKIESARDAIADYEQWLRGRLPSFTEHAGVGQAHYDWYLRHVKLMPFDTETVRAMGVSEVQRLQALLTMEQHRNRDLPLLEPASSAEDYAARIADADRDVRRWLVEQSILTIPEYVGELDTNVPWLVRPAGRNFWEEIQYRDPRPDHVHAVIPGHRFDWVVSERQAHPIRRDYWDAGRVEGWGVYVEELALRTGLLDDRPRTRELFLVFGLKRAVRVQVDVDMQLNRIGVDEAVATMRAAVPFLDVAVARTDAEIYLRRPPGYGLSYTIGKIQLERLLAKRAAQLEDGFDLRVFHDDLLSLGRVPVALLAWEITGDFGEVEALWDTTRLTDVGPARKAGS
jgi:hypothetical protein